jgi:hypothetical protein
VPEVKAAKKIKEPKPAKVKAEKKPKVPKVKRTKAEIKNQNLADKLRQIRGVELMTQPLSAEDNDKKLSSELAIQIKKLLALGKTQGFLTYEQINENLDTELDSRKIDRIVDILTEFKIQIVEKEEDVEKLIDENAKDEEKSQKRSEDSVKTYLKSMSTVKLLTIIKIRE